MRVDWVLESECNNRHVDVGYKVTSMFFIARAALGQVAMGKRCG
jgi:hypothetical protein